MHLGEYIKAVVNNEDPHAMGIELGLGHMQAKCGVWE
jgi:hypothetical protein